MAFLIHGKIVFEEVRRGVLQGGRLSALEFDITYTYRVIKL